jgi:predicted DCC family thiol-disulfide oxidoreductase YuxK
MTQRVDNPTGKIYVLWDGECGFCRRACDWLAGVVDAPDDYVFIPFQKAPRPPMTDVIYDACHDAIHLVLPDGEVRRGGDACRWLLDHSSHWRAAGALLHVPPVSWLLEPGYSTVARNRMVFSKMFFTKGRNTPTRHDIGADLCPGGECP